MFHSMFHLIFLNDGDIECEGDDLEDPNEDFCASRSIDSYLRVYAIIVGDFELSDYKQENTVVVLWFFVTFFGTVVLLNVLIAGKNIGVK
jgi:hypothetical protein